jgi:hypothetical protein
MDYNKLFYNLIHNLGNIYDNSAEFVNLMTVRMNLDDVTWWGEIGKLTGDTIN